jgi:hypothetical protein
MLGALCLVASGCAEEPAPTDRAGERPAPATPRPKPSPTAATASPTPSARPARATVGATPTPTEPATTVESTEEAPSAAPVEPPPPGAGPRAMLLRAGEMPGLNEQHRWRPIGTENGERRQPVWACQVTDFLSIGATDVWVRRFVGAPGGGDAAKARSAVITFADAQSARRAWAVLDAWHDDCEEQLRGEHRRVEVDAAPTAVEVDNGQAQWRLAIYGPAEGDPDAGYFDATGYVLDGTRISLVTMVSVGQDYNYPPGEEPIVGALRNAAVKLRG